MGSPKNRKSDIRGQQIKLVIFDVDGTLADAYAAVEASVDHLMDVLGLPPVKKRDIVRSVGWGERHLLSCFVPPGKLGKSVALYRSHHARSLETRSRLLPGVKPLLKDLKKRGCALAVASNRATRFTRLLLKILGIAGYFDYILCRDRVTHPKPHPEILLKIVRKLGVGPSEALFVGDMTVDVEAGERAGIRTVAVTTGSSSARSLRSLKPWRIVSRIDRVSALLEKVPAA